MKKKRLIPVILIKNGWVVQSRGFSFYNNLGNPITSVKRLSEWGSDELILLDISKTDDYDTRRDDQNYPNRKSFLEIIEDVAKVSNMPLTIGGKITSIEDINIRLKLGADKVAINSAAFKDKEFLKSAIKEFGSQCIVCSVDLKKIDNDFYVYIHGGTQNTNVKSEVWLKELNQIGVGEVFLNFIDRDGKKNGYELEYVKNLNQKMKVPIILCGGAGNEQHFIDAINVTDVDAIAAANIFHYSDQSVFYTKKSLIKAGLNFRKPLIIEI